MCILVIVASVIQTCRRALLDSIVCQYADNNTYVLLANPFAVYSAIVISLTRRDLKTATFS